MFFNDNLDDEDNVYPNSGTLEEKAAYSLEQQRQHFYHSKRNYEECKEGGVRHSAVMLAYGPKSAANMAANAEQAFKMLCDNLLLTPDGETTDPKYPVDKMVNAELRRIRAHVILNVAQFVHMAEEMMPEKVQDLSYEILYYCLIPYAQRYHTHVFEQINTVIPGKKLGARTTPEVVNKIMDLCRKYTSPENTNGFSIKFLLNKLRDELTEFILVDLPYNNVRLQKAELKDAGKSPDVEVKVLH